MKITLEVVKSRLRMINGIETAAIACELEEDGETINLRKKVFIIFSIYSYLYFSEKDKENVMVRYEGTAKKWKEAIFGNNNNVDVWVIDDFLDESFGKFKIINLYLEPDIIIKKEDIAERFLAIGGISEAWIVCDIGDPEKYINYRYDIGIYIKIHTGVDEKDIYPQIRDRLFLLFGGEGRIFELVSLGEEILNITYKSLDLDLKDITKIL